MNKLKCPVPRNEPVVVEPFQWPLSKTIKLSYPDMTDSILFRDILDKRETRRQFKTITITEVGHFFYLANRTLLRERNTQEMMTEHRPVISSGGLHVVDCLVLLPGETQWYRYDPLFHQLESLKITTKEISDLTTCARNFLPTASNAAIIWYVGDMTRLSGKYEHAESAIWRDAGAILATHSLVAEYLNYAFCPLGITGEDEAHFLSNKRDLMGLGLSLVGRI